MIGFAGEGFVGVVVFLDVAALLLLGEGLGEGFHNVVKHGVHDLLHQGAVSLGGTVVHRRHRGEADGGHPVQILQLLFGAEKDIGADGNAGLAGSFHEDAHVPLALGNGFLDALDPGVALGGDLVCIHDGSRGTEGQATVDLKSLIPGLQPLFENIEKQDGAQHDEGVYVNGHQRDGLPLQGVQPGVREPFPPGIQELALRFHDLNAYFAHSGSSCQYDISKIRNQIPPEKRLLPPAVGRAPAPSPGADSIRRPDPAAWPDWSWPSG